MRDFSKSLRVGNGIMYSAPYKYPDNFEIYISGKGLKIYKDGKVIGEAKSYTEAAKIIEKNGGKVKRYGAEYA